MNSVIQIEDRVSRSRSKHEGESSAEICDRLSRTRVSSQRQLPTDHDYAVPNPRNISSINRRHYLPRLLLTLSSKYNDQKPEAIRRY